MWKLTLGYNMFAQVVLSWSFKGSSIIFLKSKDHKTCMFKNFEIQNVYICKFKISKLQACFATHK